MNQYPQVNSFGQPAYGINNMNMMPLNSGGYNNPVVVPPFQQPPAFQQPIGVFGMYGQQQGPIIIQ
jgi:hypothetical protein